MCGGWVGVRKEVGWCDIDGLCGVRERGWVRKGGLWREDGRVRVRFEGGAEG